MANRNTLRKLDHGYYDTLSEAVGVEYERLGLNTEPQSVPNGSTAVAG